MKKMSVFSLVLISALSFGACLPQARIRSLSSDSNPPAQTRPGIQLPDTPNSGDSGYEEPRSSNEIKNYLIGTWITSCVAFFRLNQPDVGERYGFRFYSNGTYDSFTLRFDDFECNEYNAEEPMRFDHNQPQAFTVSASEVNQFEGVMPVFNLKLTIADQPDAYFEGTITGQDDWMGGDYFTHNEFTRIPDFY